MQLLRFHLLALLLLLSFTPCLFVCLWFCFVLFVFQAEQGDQDMLPPLFQDFKGHSLLERTDRMETGPCKILATNSLPNMPPHHYPLPTPRGAFSKAILSSISSLLVTDFPVAREKHCGPLQIRIMLG